MASREEKKAATRKKLLDAAAVIVAKQGALAASLDAIAERAGLTKGAVYSNFSSKEELLFEMAGVFAGPEVHVDPDGCETVADYLERLGEGVAEAQRTSASRAWRVGLEMYNYAIRNTRFRKLYAANDRLNRAATAADFERLAASSGETLPLSGEELHTVINALAIGLSEARTIDPEAVPDDLFPRAFRLLAG
jgi:AcrR family transcriptional regulator